MPEIIGQRITGSPMSERELFTRSIEGLHQLRDCWRGLALSRGDERWLVLARLTEEIEDKTKRLMDRRQVPFLILPRRS